MPPTNPVAVRAALSAAVCLSLTASASVSSAAEPGWTQFRGPRGDGVLPATAAGTAAPPTEWSATKNVAWTAKLPGAGWSQPVLAGDLLFVTAAVSDKPLPVKTTDGGVLDPASFGWGKNNRPDATLKWQLIALDAATGNARWTRTVAEGRPKFRAHPTNSYATETPAADPDSDGGSGRVYAWFGMAGVAAAFDRQGKELWRAEIGAFQTTEGMGTGSSPLLHGGKLILQLLNDEKSFVVALDAATGKEAWRADWGAGKFTSWSTPLLWKTAARTEVFCCGGRRVVSYDPETGKELWRMSADTGFAASPTADADRLYLGGSEPGSSATLFAVKAGAAGDISLGKGETSNAAVAWSVRGAAPSIASPVVIDGLLYILGGGGILTVLDAPDGSRVYKERLPGVGTASASPVAVGGTLYCLGETGTAVAVTAGRKFSVAGSGKLEGLFLASPAVAGDALFLRSADTVYRISAGK
jgi:outer membrane protein assembly factor BamB